MTSTSTNPSHTGTAPRRTMIDADAAAAYIGFSTGYLHRLTLAGQITVYKIHNPLTKGKRPTLRYAREDLDAWLDQYHVPATVAPAATVGTRRRRQPARSPRPVAAGTRALLSAREALADAASTPASTERQ